MKYTRMFAKTKKQSKEYDSINATLLIKAGFIDQVMAGVYTFLPLGLRVINKIEKIIREEMDKIGTEVLMPALAPKEIWETTGRFDTVDVLYKVIPANATSKAKNDAEYVLNCTHEDLITPTSKKFNLSYKDLPIAVYQMQNKFRNEARPKSGIMRGREFRMKDLYSFHATEEDLKSFYEESKVSYAKVFDRLGLGADTFIAVASGGDFTTDFTHEFQTLCETGEDTIFHAKTANIYFNREVAPSKAPSTNTKEPAKALSEVYGENIVGVDDLCAFLNIKPEHTTKTLIYETDTGVIVAAVRGDYEVNEGKLKKVADVKWLKLADEKTIEKTTGAKLGYAGILNLPKTARVFIDDAVKELVNFETGANKTNYHVTNVNWGRDLEVPEKFYDIKVAKTGDMYPETGEVYDVLRGSEVGNVFPLGTKYSKACNYTYTDKDGSQKLVWMGSYGIGISRLLGVLVEKFHDEKGIVWPRQVAPFTVHLVGLNLDDEKVRAQAEKVYETLQAAGLDVFFDDRIEDSAGEKLADADLIGIPYRLIVSRKTGENVEVKKRTENDSKVLTVSELIKLVGEQHA